jgi:hypothetical protein
MAHTDMGGTQKDFPGEMTRHPHFFLSHCSYYTGLLYYSKQCKIPTLFRR